MLEALVSLRRTGGIGAIAGSEKTLKKAGDILVIKKSPALWGADEKRFFLIVKLKDDDLEATMKDGDVVVHPFAEYVDGIIVNRCAKPVDLTAIPADSPGLDASVESGAIDIGAKGYLEQSDLKSASIL